MKLSGDVEADETYIGGLARNMHKDRRTQKISGTGGSGKAIVMGMLERGTLSKHSKVCTKVIENTQRHTLHDHIFKHVEPGSELFTDAFQAYCGLDLFYGHQVIDHAVAYAKGHVHTNTLENFWSLLKRSIKGTYVSVEPFHLFRYLDEQSFRFNNRKDNDAGRFESVLSSVAGKRLTYRHLIGQDQASTTT